MRYTSFLLTVYMRISLPISGSFMTMMQKKIGKIVFSTFKKITAMISFPETVILFRMQQSSFSHCSMGTEISENLFPFALHADGIQTAMPETSALYSVFSVVLKKSTMI